MRTVAFYLPQFHRIPENDLWWGEGFTEWTNVARARPLFAGHDHPRVPAEMGEYDLTDPLVRRQQSEMAREHDIDAFCMYFYWFDGKRLLEQPVEEWRKDEQLLPYCLSWANESWTRRWDGKERDVLMPQSYEPGFERQFFDDLVPHFRAPHYLRTNGCPVLVVHRADLIPDVRGFAARMRGYARESGLPGIHLVAAETSVGLIPQRIGFDAVAEFPPVGANLFRNAMVRGVSNLSPSFKGRLLSYPRLIKYFMNRPRPKFVRYRGVMPQWDNTARRQERATVYVGGTPHLYQQWLRWARAQEIARGDDGFVFINAWNEWAEGAYLEPDATHGDAYLRATRRESPAIPAIAPQKSGRLTYPQLRSMLLLGGGSLLALKRRVRNRLR